MKRLLIGDMANASFFHESNLVLFPSKKKERKNLALFN